jgi:hypothetical protein
MVEDPSLESGQPLGGRFSAIDRATPAEEPSRFSRHPQTRPLTARRTVGALIELGCKTAVTTNALPATIFYMEARSELTSDLPRDRAVDGDREPVVIRGQSKRVASERSSKRREGLYGAGGAVY